MEANHSDAFVAPADHPAAPPLAPVPAPAPDPAPSVAPQPASSSIPPTEVSASPPRLVRVQFNHVQIMPKLRSKDHLFITWALQTSKGPAAGGEGPHLVTPSLRTGYTRGGGNSANNMPGCYTFSSPEDPAVDITLNVPADLKVGETQTIHLRFYLWRIGSEEQLSALQKCYPNAENPELEKSITSVLQDYHSRHESAAADLTQTLSSAMSTVTSLVSLVPVPGVAAASSSLTKVPTWISDFTDLAEGIQATLLKAPAFLKELEWIFNVTKNPHGSCSWKLKTFPEGGFWSQREPGSGSLAYLLAENSALDIMMVTNFQTPSHKLLHHDPVTHTVMIRGRISVDEYWP